MVYLSGLQWIISLKCTSMCIRLCVIAGQDIAAAHFCHLKDQEITMVTIFPLGYTHKLMRITCLNRGYINY